MKKIYIEAEVVDENNTQFTGIKIGGEYIILYVPKKDLEKAQVLAVEQIREMLRRDYSGSHEFAIDLSGTWVIRDSNREFVNGGNYDKLTELVTGKERTALDTIKAISSLIDDNNGITDKHLFEKLISELREQLLKNRE